MQIRNLDYLRQKDPRLYEALSDIVQGQKNIAQQVNADPNGEPLPPPAIDSLHVTGANGHFNVAIEHAGDMYRGVQYYVEHSDNPQFQNAHTVPLGHSRNANIFLGNTKRYFRAYAAYPTSKAGPPVYHGGAIEPIPVAGGGIVGAPALLDSQGSGTGSAGEGLSGPGALPFRSSTGAPPVRGLQTEATGSARTPSGSAAGLPSGAQVIAAGGGGGSSAGAGGGAGPQGPAGPGVPAGGTDGQLLAKASATDYDTEWIDAPTGGGGGFPGVVTLVRPSLADFSVVSTNPTRFTVADDDYGILAYRNAGTPSGDDWYLLVQNAPGAPYTATVGIQVLAQVSVNWTFAGAVVRASASGSFVAAYFANDSTGFVKWNNPTSYNAGYTMTNVQIPRMTPFTFFYRFADDGANRTVSVSVDGVHFVAYGQTPRTDFITPDQAGFGLGANFAAPAYCTPLIVRFTHWSVTTP